MEKMVESPQRILFLITIISVIVISASCCFGGYYPDYEEPSGDGYNSGAIGFGVGIFIGFTCGYHCGKGEKQR